MKQAVVWIGALLLLGTCGLVFSDEIVSRANGQKILLKNDSTWEAVAETTTTCLALSAAKNIFVSPQEAVEVWDKSMSLTDAQCGKAVALYLHYCNHTDKKVIGVTVSFAIENAFGVIVFDDTVNDEVALEPYEKKRSTTFWRFADNPFLVDEPYDKIWEMAQNGTARIHTEILKVIFDDNTTLPVTEPQKVLSKPTHKKKAK